MSPFGLACLAISPFRVGVDPMLAPAAPRFQQLAPCSFSWSADRRQVPSQG